MPKADKAVNRVRMTALSVFDMRGGTVTGSKKLERPLKSVRVSGGAPLKTISHVMEHQLKTKALLILALIGAANASFAADISQTINPLSDATKVMDQCTAIAKNIAAIKPPAGHAEARATEQLNETLAKENEKAQLAKAPGVKPAEIDPALLKKITPEQQAFLTNIRAQRKDLQKCGEAYAKVNTGMQAFVKKTSDALADPAKKPNDDDKKIADAIVAYMKAGENLSTAITVLSKDDVLKHYVSRPVEKYFLGQNVPGNE